MKKLNPEVYEIVMESIKDLRSNCAETELLRQAGINASVTAYGEEIFNDMSDEETNSVVDFAIHVQLIMTQLGMHVLSRWDEAKEILGEDFCREFEEDEVIQQLFIDDDETDE